jgi:hypothetical protein
MKYGILDVVVLDRELPDRGLRKGDLGAVVEVYEPDGLEVEFVTASGKMEALLTLRVGDVRPEVYRIIPDPKAAKDDFVRIIDESDEDYLYHKSHFVFVEFPKAVAKKILSLHGATA